MRTYAKWRASRFFISSADRGEHAHIEVDRNPRGSTHVLAYDLGREKRDLYRVTVNYKAFDAAVAGLEDAVIEMLSRPPVPKFQDDTVFAYRDRNMTVLAEKKKELLRLAA